MHVAQVSFFRDRQDRPPAALLRAWPSLVDVAGAAARTGLEVTVVQASRQDAVFEQDGVTVHFVGAARSPKWIWEPVKNLQSAGAVVSHLRQLRPDVIHVHGLGFPFQTGMVSRRLPAVPILVQDHANRVPVGWRARAFRIGHARISGTAFTSSEQASQFVAKGLFGPGIRVFEVAESSSHFTPGDQLQARRELTVKGDPCVAWIGRMNANKDPLTVLAAFRAAAPRLKDPHLWCCYTDVSLLRAARSAAENDPVLAGRVHFLGELPHERVEVLLRAADFLMLGSHVEGSGFAVIESLACGTPPLVTDIPSFRKLTGHGRVGALSPPGDSEAMARALLEWTARPRGASRAMARRHFEAELSFEAIGQRLRVAYDTLGKHHRRPKSLE